MSGAEFGHIALVPDLSGMTVPKPPKAQTRAPPPPLASLGPAGPRGVLVALRERR